MECLNNIRIPSSLLFVLCLIFSTSSSFCPQYCACDDTALGVTCHSSSNLRVVPIFLNPQIKSLTLSKNQIKDITLSLQFYQELNHLDISANHIPSLGKGNFESLRNLESLNVSYNEIKVLESGVFQGLGALKSLDLSGNQIEKVERDTFWNLKNAKEIILDRNRLEFIDWDLFRGLEKLMKISVQFNFIQVIEPSATLFSSPLKSVQIVDVSSNQLTRVKDNSLQVFSGLKELNLCCNYIHTLEDKAFVGLYSLDKVNLSQNRLGRVPSVSLGALASSLIHLDLSSNRLTPSLDKTSFPSLLHLKVLRINDNSGLVAIHPEAFSELINLVNFEGDYLTNLTEFSGSLLNNKPNLRRFSMKYCQISEVPQELVKDISVPSARALDLRGNPIDCNCSAFSLYKYLDHYSNQDGESEHDFHLSEDFSSSPLLNSGGNMSQAHYIDNSLQSNNKKTKQNLAPFFLSGIRCHAPNSVSGVLVKDLKNSDFAECFTTDDHFQVLVVCIAAVIVFLIFLIVGVKLCCLSERGCGCSCNKNSCCTKRKGSEEWRFCPCFNKRDKELDANKCDRSFEGFRVPSSGATLRPQSHSPFLEGQIRRSPSGKLFFSADNSSPSHQPQSQPLFYSQFPSHTLSRNYPPAAEDEDNEDYHPIPHPSIRQNTLHHTLGGRYNQPLPPSPHHHLHLNPMGQLPPYNYNSYNFVNGSLYKPRLVNTNPRNYCLDNGDFDESDYTSPVEFGGNRHMPIHNSRTLHFPS